MKNFYNEVKFLFPYFKKYYFKICIGGAGIILLSVLLLPAPLLTKQIVDVIIPTKDFSQLISLIIIIFCLLLLQLVITYANSIMFMSINNTVVMNIKLDLLAAIHQLPNSELGKYSTGYLMSRINDDAASLQSLFANTFIRIFKDVVRFIIGIFVLIYLDYKMTLMTVALLPVYIFVSIYYTKSIKEKTLTLYEKNAQLNSQLHESINIIELCKIFLQKNFNLSKYGSRLNDNFMAVISISKISLLNNIITGFILDLIPLIVLGYGGYRIIIGDFSLGSLIAFISFTSLIFGPANSLISINIEIQKGLIALKRIKYFFQQPVEPDGNISLGSVKGIEFKDIHFSYPASQKKEALCKFNLRIPTPMKIGIVGSSGCGKSTFIKLLLRLYEPDSGEILINGENITNFSLNSLRAKIGYIEQEPLLLNDTIYNNIVLGLKDKTNKDIMVEVTKAANLAGADFINKLPGKYNYQVGEQGGLLSIGQKQRIAIARALVDNPEIIIFDEATSNLDSESEYMIMKAINKLPSSKHVIIISHRLNFISECDKIFVLQDGYIVEEGTHNELLGNNGIFARYKNFFYLNE